MPKVRREKSAASQLPADYRNLGMRTFAPRTFGMHQLPTILLSRAQWPRTGHSYGKLEEVYASADYLTLHVGLTPQTNRND